MRKLFYATKNKFKIQNMQDRLKGMDIEIVTPYDINAEVDVNENGKSVTENAMLKAKAYIGKVCMPIIAADSSLYIEKFEIQPGLLVRRVGGKYLNDDELEEYYIQELSKVGGESDAYYITGLAMIAEDGGLKTVEIREEPFILKASISNACRNNDALGRLEYDPCTNKYFCEMTLEDKKVRESKFDKQCVDFILNSM